MTTRLRFNQYSLVGCFALLSFYCMLSGCRKGTNIPSVSHIDGSFKLERFDQALWSLDSTVTAAETAQLAREVPALWDLYFTHILPMPRDEGLDSIAAIRDLLSNPRLRAIADSVSVTFRDMSDISEEFRRAFQFYQYYFPGNRTPNIYTLISDYSYFPFIFEDTPARDGIGIGLEFFLGSGFPYTTFAGDNPTFSEYLVRTYNKDHLVKRALDVLIDDIAGPPPGDRLLDLMIHNGKKLYLLEQILPEHPDSIILEFSPEQIAWCEDNERQIWAHLLTEDLLYSNDFTRINKLVTHSPNVPGMPPGAPGRVANWTGWRIIHSAVHRNPGLSATDLVAMRDAQELLELARYRPR